MRADPRASERRSERASEQGVDRGAAERRIEQASECGSQRTQARAHAGHPRHAAGGGRGLLSRAVEWLRAHAVGVAFGMTATGSVGTSLLLHLEPVVTPVSMALAIAAATAWLSRTALHLKAGRLVSLTLWTLLEWLVGAAWVFACVLVVHPTMRVGAVWLLAGVTGASFFVALLSEAALDGENESRVAAQQEPIQTGRAYFRDQKTKRLTGLRVVESFGPLGRAANSDSRSWRFSGLVMSLVMCGALSVCGLVGSALTVFGTAGVAAAPTISPTPSPSPTSARLLSSSLPAPDSTSPAVPSESATVTLLPAAPPVPRGIEKLKYDEACANVASQEPGGDAPPWASDRFSTLYFGPGEGYTGCAQPTRSNHAGSCQWEVGLLDGAVASVAVVTRALGDALFYNGTAQPIIDLLNAGYCVGGTKATVVYSGDAQLMYTKFGTQMLLRATEFIPSGPAPHLLLSPAMTLALLAAMRHFDEWLWPVSDGIPGEYRLVDRNLAPVNATLAPIGAPGRDVVAITAEGFAPSFTSGAQIRWPAFAHFIR